MERGERGGGRRRRVALDQEAVGGQSFEDLVHGRQHARGEGVEPLSGAHQIEVEVWGDAEARLHLIDRLPMLRGRAHGDLEGVRPGLEGTHHGCHLDHLGPGPVEH